jgi:hypothetical protein
VLVAMAITDDPAATFTRDLLAQALEGGAQLPFYAGALSVLNGWVWASAGVLALAAAVLVPWRRRWMLSLAALLLLVAVDDAFMLHELAGPDRGVPEAVFLALYPVAGLLLLAQVRGRRGPDVLAFVLGGAFLALSVGVDVAFQEDVLLLEDGVKLLGGLMWLAVPFLVLAELRAVPAVTRTPASRSRADAPAPDRSARATARAPQRIP